MIRFIINQHFLQLRVGFFSQVEDTFQEGQQKEEQQQEEKIKAEDNAIEMSEDFDGQTYDMDENEAGNYSFGTTSWWKSGVSVCFIMRCFNLTDKDDDISEDDEEEQELDKKMGDLGEGHTDTLDEKMWGDDEDNDEEEDCKKEEESGHGMDQV